MDTDKKLEIIEKANEYESTCFVNCCKCGKEIKEEEGITHEEDTIFCMNCSDELDAEFEDIIAEQQQHREEIIKAKNE